MAFTITNRSARGQMSGTSAQEVTLLTGASGSTIVKTLEIINPESSSCNVDVIRKDGNGTAYATISVEVKANDYLILWEGFYVIPQSHTLVFKANSTQCEVVASIVERT